MSTPTPRSGGHARSARTGKAVGFAAALVLLVTGALALREYGPGNMWAGYLVGGSVVLVLFGFALWRTSRSPATTTTAERAVSAAADERDVAVRQSAFATLGALALPFTGLAAVAVAVGAPDMVVFGILLWVLLGVLVFAFWRADRRM